MIFRRFVARSEHRPTSTRRPEGALRIRWLGTAGHVIEGGGTTLLVDPFLTRTSLWTTATKALVPIPDAWRHHLPPRVDAILLGHSHYDHLLDAPVIAKETGATIVGSATTAAFARASGVAEEKIVVVPPEGRTLTIGAAEIRFVPSLHGKILLGRVVFPGENSAVESLPKRVWDYKMGGAFGVHVTIGRTRVYHNGSANLVDAELEGREADVLLVGLAGRKGTPSYVDRLARLVKPRLVVPTHHDAFFAPLESGLRLLPGIDLEGFFRCARDAMPSARVVTPTYEDDLFVGEDARDAVLVAA